jgi:dipeptidyl-peptidase 9
MAGSPPYVIQEEFDRYTGCWWQPAASGSASVCLLYEHVDESLVDEIRIPEYSMKDGMETYRYPRVGAVNPSVELEVWRRMEGGSKCQEDVRTYG